MTRKSKKWLLGGTALLFAALAAVGAVAKEGRGTEEQRAAPVIEPKAEDLLRRMSDYLSNLPAFSIETESIDEVVLESGQKLQFPAASQIYVQRPKYLRSDRVGMVDVSLYYDGANMTLFGRDHALYATSGAPATLDEAIDFARRRLNLEAPGADLLYSNPYQILTEDVIRGRYLGTTQLNGVLVHHLAFEGNETNWEIWIDDGPRPLPRRFVITSKKMPSFPQFTVSMTKWDVTPLFPTEMFTYVPSPDAKKITFEQVSQRITEKQAEIQPVSGEEEE